MGSPGRGDRRVGYVTLAPEGAVYDLGDDHPINPARRLLAVELIEESGLLEHPALTVLRAEPATEEELERVHASAYVDAVRRLGGEDDPGHLPEALSWGLGAEGDTPAFRGMHEAGLEVCGSALTGVRALLEDRADAVFSQGGLHHAFAKRANGFCIYNDCAVAIQAALDAGAERVAYIDIDVHHGDGVEQIFWEEPRVLTCSVHEGGRTLFPGTGWIADRGGAGAFRSAVNVPLPALAGDGPYLRAITDVIAPAVGAFEPDLVVTQMGVDPHHQDPLAHLEVTIPGLRAAHEAVEEIAVGAPRGRWLALAGGGYNVDLVPRMWTQLLAQMLGVELDDELPPGWVARAESQTGAKLTPRLREDAPPRAPAEAREQADRRADRIVDQAIEQLVEG